MKNENYKCKIIKLKSLIVILITACISITSHSDSLAQSNVQTWSSIMLSGEIGDRLTFGVRPMVRYESTYGDYNLTSLDLMVKYKFDNGFSAFILQRHAVRDDGIRRNLILMDLRHSFQLMKGIIMTNSIRWHLAHDIEIDDPNFMCYLGTLKIFPKNFISSFIGIQYFHRLDGINELSRIRYRAGINYKITPKWKISIRLWNTKKLQETGSTNSYVILPSLIYSL